MSQYGQYIITPQNNNNSNNVAGSIKEYSHSLSFDDNNDISSFLYTDKVIASNNNLDTILFEKDTCYYVKFSVNRSTTIDQTIELKLIDPTNNKQQYLKTIEVNHAPVEGKKYYFSLIFTPFDNFTGLLFNLKRTPNIFNTPDISLISLQQVPNLISSMISTPENSDVIITKLAVQGPYGTWLNLNGDGVRIGRSGIYEIADDNITIERFGIVNPNPSFLIIDFEYDIITSPIYNNNEVIVTDGNS